MSTVSSPGSSPTHGESHAQPPRLPSGCSWPAGPRRHWRFLSASAPTTGALPEKWQDVRIAAFEAVGRADGARAIRWARFEPWIKEEDLRVSLERWPEAERRAAEERAMACAMHDPHTRRALNFFVRWPALGRASEFILSRYRRSGSRIFPLSPGLSRHSRMIIRSQRPLRSWR